MITDLGIEEPGELDIELIAAHHDVYVTYRALENQEGHLLRTSDMGLVVVDEVAKRTNKWRFVIAHELGHYLLHPEDDQFHICTTQDLQGLRPRNQQEAEANDFASELLMPTQMMERETAHLGFDELHGLGTISRLATRFQTSLTAMALRFVGRTHIPCAIAHATRDRIDWWTGSPTFEPKLKRGARLKQETYAHALFRGESLPNAPLPNHGGAWSGTMRTRHMTLFEHSLLLKSYHSVLTMLWHAPRS